MKQHGPLKIKKSIPKYKNPWINVREDQVVMPDGGNGIFGIVDMNPGISVLAVDHENNAYLVEEFRYALGRMSIEVSNGAIDPGETPLEAAQRELREESGIIAKDWIDLGAVNPFTTVINSPSYQFLARKLTFTESQPEKNEFIQKIKMPYKEALEKVMKGEITHSPSCVAILKAQKYLNL